MNNFGFNIGNSSAPTSRKLKYLQRSHVGRGPKGYKKSSEKIREEVCEILYRDPEVDASDIEVLVDNGIVFLNGSVDRENKLQKFL